MLETGRRAHISQAFRVQQLDWNAHIPDEREGVDNDQLLEPCQEPWFKAKSSFGYQLPSVVLLEEVILRNDVDVKGNKAVRQRLKMDAEGNRPGIDGKSVRAVNRRQTVDERGTTASKPGIKMDRTGAGVFTKGAKMDGKGDSAIQQDVKMVETGTDTAKKGVKANKKANDSTNADKKGIKQNIRVDGKGALPPTAGSAGVVRRMELDAGNIYVCK